MGNKEEELEAKVYQKALLFLPLLKLGGVNPMTGVGLLMVTGCSEEMGQEGEAEGLTSFYIKGWIECGEPSLKSRHEKVKSLWIRIRD